jgi:hypothetical protein
VQGYLSFVEEENSIGSLHGHPGHDYCLSQPVAKSVEWYRTELAMNDKDTG